MKKILDTRVELRMNSEELAFIGEQADRLGLTRSHLMRNLLDIGLDDLRLMRRFGLVSLVGFVRDKKINPKDILELGYNSDDEKEQ